MAGGLPDSAFSHGYRLPPAMTVLRRIRDKPGLTPTAVPVRNLGVDDWAWRKGEDYGTILVNLDIHRVVDLLPDRAAESLAVWLQQHPETSTVSRDRFGLYAEGASTGAPQTQQIADRFHLILNLSSTMERVLEECSRELILPCAESVPVTPTADSPAAVAPQATRSQLRRQRRLERSQQVVTFFRTVNRRRPSAVL